MEISFEGEEFPADFVEMNFNGVTIARFIGPMDAVKISADNYIEKFPIEIFDTRAVRNAFIKSYKPLEWELIIVRKQFGG